MMSGRARSWSSLCGRRDPVSFPLLKTAGGKLVDLQWTRLKPAEEVELITPPAPLPTRRPGMSLGPEVTLFEGDGFDHRAVVSAVVEADDGVFEIGGKEVKGRSLTGETLRYEPDRAWTAHELDLAESAAVEILRAHAFPVLIQWPAGVWAWSEGDLFWADAPAHSVLVNEGREDSGMSGVTRAGLGWPISPRRDDEARAALRWPRFSAFGWALEIITRQEYRRLCVATSQRLNLERMRYLVGQTYDSEALSFEEERARASVERCLDSAWQIGFDLGSYLSEHRVRTLHSEMLERGQKNRRATADGGAITNAKKKTNITARRAEILRLAPGVLNNGQLLDGYRAWSIEALATCLRDKWAQSPPTISTLKADIVALGGVDRIREVER